MFTLIRFPNVRLKRKKTVISKMETKMVLTHGSFLPPIDMINWNFVKNLFTIQLYTLIVQYSQCIHEVYLN